MEPPELDPEEEIEEDAEEDLEEDADVSDFVTTLAPPADPDSCPCVSNNLVSSAPSATTGGW